MLAALETLPESVMESLAAVTRKSFSPGRISCSRCLSVETSSATSTSYTRWPALSCHKVMVCRAGCLAGDVDLVGGNQDEVGDIRVGQRNPLDRFGALQDHRLACLDLQPARILYLQRGISY